MVSVKGFPRGEVKMISLRREGASHVISKGGKPSRQRAAGAKALRLGMFKKDAGVQEARRERQVVALARAITVSVPPRKLLKDVKPHNVTPLFIF